ncbi:Hok/Gef family protein [Dryocola sp. BD626]|uniref:Hok/Gef family protein n=1 Tax=Dryocola sp. BD626 TaxID=3133273 RepID=UPI003F5028CB
MVVLLKRNFNRGAMKKALKLYGLLIVCLTLITIIFLIQDSLCEFFFINKDVMISGKLSWVSR